MIISFVEPQNGSPGIPVRKPPPTELHASLANAAVIERRRQCCRNAFNATVETTAPLNGSKPLHSCECR
jgi:hypothetical protein